MKIEIPKEKEKQMISSIKRYFDENMEEEIGDLKASLLLDFCITEIGACVYNQAVADAQAVMMEKVNDLEGSCFQEEFGYWET